jgi:hypothetical protein
MFGDEPVGYVHAWGLVFGRYVLQKLGYAEAGVGHFGFELLGLLFPFGVAVNIGHQHYLAAMQYAAFVGREAL